MEDITPKVIEYILDSKQKLGIHRSDLADMADIPHSTLDRILKNNHTSVSIDNIYRIASVLGISIDVATGLRSESSEPLTNATAVKQAYDEAKVNLTAVLHEKDKAIEARDKIIEHHKKELRFERIKSIVLVIAMILIFVFVRLTTV